MKKHVPRRPWITEEDDFLVNNLNMPHKAIGKKLKRSSTAISLRRYKLGITKAHSKHTKIGPAYVEEASAPISSRREQIRANVDARYKQRAIQKAASEERKAAKRTARLLTPQTPVVPVYTYEGKHNIATFNKLGWFTRTLLGVKAA